MRESIPEEVVRFIDEYIDTVPHLETLLLMRRSERAEWNAERIAARVYVNLPTARAILGDLTQRGMLESLANDTFVYSTQWEREHPQMHQLEESYRTALVRVSQLIHAKAAGSLRDFARAFRLKSDK